MIQNLTGTAVVAALVSGAVSFVGAVMSNRTSAKINREKIHADIDLADRRFRYEREMHDYKRRVDLGEEILAGFYELRDLIADVRNPGSVGNEGATRERRAGETPDQERGRDVYFVPFERLAKGREFLASFYSKRYRARAMFGTDIDKSFRDTHQAMVHIRVSAGMLIAAVGDDRRDPDFWARCEGDIWAIGAGPDRVASLVDGAVTHAEQILGPILSRKTET